MNNQDRGYEFFIDRRSNILKVKAWGVWDVAYAEQYDRDLQKHVLQISQYAPQGWYVLVDLNNFPPQIPAVQPILVRGMNFGITHGLKKEARLIGQALTQLQLKRLVKEAGMPENSTFQSENDAVKWLLKD